jgi:hypothetical protein
MTIKALSSENLNSSLLSAGPVLRLLLLCLVLSIIFVASVLSRGKDETIDEFKGDTYLAVPDGFFKINDFKEERLLVGVRLLVLVATNHCT